MSKVKYNNLSPLPFYKVYTNEERIWDSNRWYAYGNIYPLLTPSVMMNFFFYMEKGETLTDIKVYKLCEESGGNVSRADFEEVSGDWLTIFRGNGLVEKSELVLFTTLNAVMFDRGYYFIEMVGSRTDHTFVSEIFRISQPSERKISMKWWNFDNIESEGTTIPYKDGYVNTLEVESTIGMPTYEMEEEGEKRMGFFYPTKQISYKKYRFTFVAPEYLCDVVRLIPLADTIRLEDEDGYVLNPTDFNVDFKWLDGGHYAQVDCEFTTNTVVRKIGGMKIVEGKSFNKDFGNSFH